MFGRKSSKSKTEVSQFDYYIQLKEKSISDWVGSNAEISCGADWKANYSDAVDHIINYIPKAGVHFHRTPGVFSESVSGGYRTCDDLDIEWGIQGGHFIVWLPMQDKVLFCCPLTRAAQMLSDGHNGTQNITGESKVIDIELDDNQQTTSCRKVLEKSWSTYSLIYSNDLVQVTFEIAPKHNVLHYDSY